MLFPSLSRHTCITSTQAYLYRMRTCMCVRKRRWGRREREGLTDGLSLAEPVEDGARVGYLRHEPLAKPGVAERLVVPTVLHLQHSGARNTEHEQ